MPLIMMQEITDYKFRFEFIFEISKVPAIFIEIQRLQMHYILMISPLSYTVI